MDDDIDTLEVFSEFLEIKDINVKGRGHDGKQAAELFQKHKPDFVLMDVMMPLYDGFYGIEKIREVDPNAKIIMITADVSSETRKKLSELKPAAVVSKPYEIDDLLNLMNELGHGQTAIISKNKS